MDISQFQVILPIHIEISVLIMYIIIQQFLYVIRVLFGDEDGVDAFTIFLKISTSVLHLYTL
jgi:hypothetical protein